MELDRKLDEAKGQMPLLLQMPDISELVTDPAEQLMCRFNLDLLYLKTKIVLHRRYMEKPFSQLTPEEQKVGIGYSRRTCVNCALRVLHHHHTIYTASQSGGQLDSVKWYMGSISTHDFLLAAMVICLELSQHINGYAFPPNSPLRDCPHRGAMMIALEKSQTIWSKASAVKRQMLQSAYPNTHGGSYMVDDTEKASRSMAAMIAKVKAQFPARDDSWERDGSSPIPPIPQQLKSARLPGLAHLEPSSNLEFGGVVSYHDWGNMPDMPENIRLSTNGQQSKGYDYPSTAENDGYAEALAGEAVPQRDTNQPDLTMIDDMLNLQGDVDWAAWDISVNRNDHMGFSNDYAMDTAGDMAAIGLSPTPGNTLSGGSGPVTNSSSGVSDQATPSRNIYPGSWMAFPDEINFNFDAENGMEYT